MNLKEAFRYQNKLQSFMDDAQSILDRDTNVTRVENTYLRHKVMTEAEDETVLAVPETEYYEQITDIARFLLYLLDEKGKLFAAIRKTKSELDIDMDSAVSLNATRQSIARTFKRMNDLRNSEQTITGGGTGYRFNAEGNQISYRCDVRRVTTINYDRKVIRAALGRLNQKADETSTKNRPVPCHVKGGLRAAFRCERQLCRSIRDVHRKCRGIMPRHGPAILDAASQENADTGSGADER